MGFVYRFLRPKKFIEDLFSVTKDEVQYFNGGITRCIQEK